MQKWQKPEAGIVKVNADAAFNADRAAIGVDAAKAMAVFLAKFRNVKLVIFEGDSKLIIWIILEKCRVVRFGVCFTSRFC